MRTEKGENPPAGGEGRRSRRKRREMPFFREEGWLGTRCDEEEVSLGCLGGSDGSASDF